MKRRSIVGLALLLLAGCQDYKFNPVGKCIIQTGSAKVAVSSVSTADILFVVDDSGSMAYEQARLAANFGSFINALAKTQADRKAAGLEPLEFHIAITTSSVFEAYKGYDLTNATLQADLGQPKAPQELCSGAGQCTIATPYYGWTYSACWGQPANCAWQYQPYIYPSTDYSYPACSAGTQCVDVVDRYWAGCSATQFGQGVRGAKFPSGDFMAAPLITTPDAQRNPRVLHFTKDLAWETWGTSSVDPKITTLISQFQQNINVGACGSGMEQHFEGGRLAVQKALAGTQPGIAKGEWPHDNAKLVVVWVGDEDDCSNPKNPNTSVSFTPWVNPATEPDPNPAGSDACTTEGPKGAAGKLNKISDYASYFVGLGRPFSAAFIYSANPATCVPDASGNIVCTPGTCTCECPPSCKGACGSNASGECRIDASCGGKAAGWVETDGSHHSRFHDLSAAFRGAGASTLDGSVCAADFGKTLSGIADLVKPPSGVTLPTQPAATDVTLLEVQGTGGSTRACVGPDPTKDWWFVDCNTGANAPAGQTTKCIKLNDPGKLSAACKPSAGETYVAQYVGVLPAGGCATATECAGALGGSASEWACCAGTTTGADGKAVCVAPTASQRGTCLCSDQL